VACQAAPQVFVEFRRSGYRYLIHHMATKRSSEDEASPTMKIIKSSRESINIYGGELSLLSKATKQKLPKTKSSNQGNTVGIRPHLMDKMMARTLREFNPTHGTCLDSKRGSTVGLGLRDQSVHEVLDPLCKFSFQDLLDAVADDYWETGEGFIEVVWDEKRTEIQALNHVESAQTYVEVEEEDNSQDFHYLVSSETRMQVMMAAFDDLLDLRKRYGMTGSGDMRRGTATRRSTPRRWGTGNTLVPSELIHIRQATNKSRWYGFPDYLSATPSIELAQCMTQHEFDFYFNRAVPEFILFVLGKAVTTKSWEQIEQTIKANQGLTNSHKTAAIHIPGSADETKVQLEKLAMEETGENGFSDKSAAIAMAIATAHGIPPILANILLPGKIGAANETPNALLLYQKRKLGQAQRNFSAMLAKSLGSGVKFAQPTGKSVTLTREQFLGKSGKPKPNPMDPKAAMGATDENGMPIFQQPGNGFSTVLDGMTLGAQQTLASMKEPLATSDRNPEDGLLGGNSDRKKTDKKKKPGR